MTISRIGNKHLPGRPGFTLIEILIAVSILAVGIMGILRAYSASVTAMENATYGIDAAYSLKTVMGVIEEKAIIDKGTSSGTSSGELAPSGESGESSSRYDKWRWNMDVRQTALQIKAPVDETTDEAAAATAVTAAEETGYFLNEVDLTVVNPARSPAKNINMVTYMESESVEL